MPNTTLQALRRAMQQHHLDAYIIPSSDPHQSEYVADHWASRAYVSGFTGSAGTVVVTQSAAGLWTDGRYYLQGEQQLEGSGIDLHKYGEEGVLNYPEWLCEQLPEGAIVGFDGNVVSVQQMRTLQAKLAEHSIGIEAQHDLIPTVWTTDRPELPKASLFEHDARYTGMTRPRKLTTVRERVAASGAQYHLISTLDDIGWLLNLRGSDVNANPVFIAFVLLEVRSEQTHLFVDTAKVSDELQQRLSVDNVVLHDYDKVPEVLATLSEGSRLLLDPGSTSTRMYRHLGAGVEIIEASNPSTLLKAIKNDTEINHIRAAMRRDAVALVKLYRWLESEIQQRPVKETEVAERLAAYRAEDERYYGESFDAIVGYRGNGAIIHYRAEEGTAADIEPEGLLLLDSGGQYHDGTTDITRTVALGTPTEPERLHYTLVLKGHIALAMAHFPAGTRGNQLDALARQYLWRENLDYQHGTGHGVGFFMNVHEGPQGFVTHNTPKGNTKLQPGMVLSNEPGYYEPGSHGIRIENLVIVQPAEARNGFCTLETVTLFPIATDLIVADRMSRDEIAWLNAYHQRVYDEVAPLLPDTASRDWLRNKCATL